MNKKILFMLLFFILNINIFSYDYEDYNIFIQGKSAFEEEDYPSAQEKFELLMDSFSYSPILKNNYAFYFIGMTYYHLKDYEKAIYYLQKAVFTYDSSLLGKGKDAILERNKYFSERDFSLGDALLKTGNTELGKTYLKRIDYSHYSPISSYFEKKALLLLIQNDLKFKDYFDLKFNFNLKVADKLSGDQLLKIVKFFHSQQKFNDSFLVAEKIISSPSIDIKIKNQAIIEIFRMYLENKDYKKVIELSNKYINTLDKNTLFFYKGVAYYKLKDFSRCLYSFENIKSGDYLPTSLLYTAGIYYSFGDYNTVISIINKIPKKNIIPQIMLANSYLKLKKIKKFKETAQNIINNYPNSYEGLFFSFILENENINLNSHNAIFKISLIIKNFIDSAKTDIKEVMDKINNLELQKLCDIAKIKDIELLKIELQNSSFINKYAVSNGVAISIILENGEFYDLAFKNATEYRKEFFKYKELIKYNYPLYYKELVNQASIKYDVPQELIYTSILLCSKFDKNAMSEDAKIGLMMLPFKSAEDMIEFLKPNVNIDLGTKKLKNLLIQYDNDKLKALICYNFGEATLKNIKFDYDDDINLDSISNPEEKYEIQNLIITYTFYKNLYNF